MDSGKRRQGRALCVSGQTERGPGDVGDRRIMLSGGNPVEDSFEVDGEGGFLDRLVGDPLGLSKLSSGFVGSGSEFTNLLATVISSAHPKLRYITPSTLTRGGCPPEPDKKVPVGRTLGVLWLLPPNLASVGLT